MPNDEMTSAPNQAPPNAINDSPEVAPPTEPPAPEVADVSASGDTGQTPVPDGPNSFDEIVDAANATRKEHNLPTLDEAVHANVDTSPDLLKPLRDAVQSGMSYDWHNLLPDMYGIGQAAVYGLGAGAQEAVRTSNDVWNSNIGPGGMGANLDDTVGRLLFPGNKVLEASQQQARADRMAGVTDFDAQIPNIAEMLGVPKPDTALENIVGTVTPFIAATLLGEGPLEGLGVASKLHGVEIPGMFGNALARLGLTPAATVHTLDTALKMMAVGGAGQSKDTHNFADMLDSFKDRKDLIGSTARVWLNSVPGEKWLVHDEHDDPTMARFKNALDIGYGELIAPLVYFAARGARIGAMAVKGELAPEILEQAGRDQSMVQRVMSKIGRASNDPQHWENLKSEGNAMSESEAMQNISPDGPLQGHVSNTDPVATDLSAVPDAGLDPSIGDIPKKSSIPTNQPPGATLSGVKDMSFRDRLVLFDSESEQRINQRIAEGAAQADKDAKETVANLASHTERFKNLIERTGGVVGRSAFDHEGYYNHLVSSLASDSPGALDRAVHDYGQFIEHGPDGELPTLLTPRQLNGWDHTPYEVAGNVVDNLKRLTTTNADRKDAAERALAGLYGDPSSPEYTKLAKVMLSETARSSNEVQRAGQMQLMNSMHINGRLVPDLEKAASVLKRNPEDMIAKKAIRSITEHALMYTEANKNLRSALGAALQSAQIDPEAEGILRQMYGPQQYKNLFNKGEIVANERAGIGEQVPSAGDPALLDPERDWTPGDDQLVSQLLHHYNGLQQDAKGDWAAGMFRASQHPMWTSLGSAADFIPKVGSSLLMSTVLFNNATWSRVFQSSLISGIYDSASQALFAGGALSKIEAKKLTYDALHRITATPYSLMVAGKSFLRPELQSTYNLGTGLFTHPKFLGHEMWEGSFGKDFATKLFASGGGTTERLLRGVGAGLGFGQHVLGSVETMINHGALSSQLAGTLFEDALHSGLSDVEAHSFVNKHLPDIMEDAIVAHNVPRGNVRMRNTIGYKPEQLREEVINADQKAAYESMRENGKTAPATATTRLADTIPFRVATSLTDFLQSLPVIGPLARSGLAPFANVGANMISRGVLPTQVAIENIARMFGRPGSSKYVSEVMDGLHGPYKQARLNGHAALYWAFNALGAASMHHALSTGHVMNYPIGAAAEGEAASEGRVRFGESPLPDGGTITTDGWAPTVNPYNTGAYLQWINEHHYTGSPEQNIAEAGQHLLKAGAVAFPIAPMWQGLVDLLGGMGSDAGGVHALNGVAKTAGSMLGRPLRMTNLLPGRQTAGKSMAVTTGGYQTAFWSGMGGPGIGPSADRIIGYDYNGEAIPDKYDPDNTVNQYLEAFAFPVYKPPMSKPLDQYMALLESHGISLPKADASQSLLVPFKGAPSEYRTKINMQLYYNPKTKEHLWDVYNRFIREQKVDGAEVGIYNRKPMSVKEAMDAVATKYLDTEKGPHASSVSRYEVPVQVIPHLNASANWMQTILTTRREKAKSNLEQFIMEHGDDFVDSRGLTLTQKAKSLYHDPNDAPKD